MLGPPRTECLEHIAKEVARHRPTHLVIDLGPWPFTPDPGMLTALSEVHRGWVIRGFKVGYSATRPASRGAAVVVMHRADDMDGIVAATAEQAMDALRKGLRRVPDPLTRLGAGKVQPKNRPSTLATQVVTQGITWITKARTGMESPFAEHLVRTYGITGVAGALGPALEGAIGRLEATLGPFESQLVLSVIATFNGCSFCGPGHLYTANLLYFEETGELLPLDEEAVTTWTQQVDHAILDTYRERLTDRQWHPVLDLIERAYALRDPDEPVEGELDRVLREAIDAWALINECSLQLAENPLVPMHPRVARARRLQAAYREAREAHRERRAA